MPPQRAADAGAFTTDTGQHLRLTPYGDHSLLVSSGGVAMCVDKAPLRLSFLDGKTRRPTDARARCSADRRLPVAPAASP